MESESFGTNPRVSEIVLAVMEHFAIELFIGIVTSLLTYTVKFTLRKQKGQTIGLVFFLFNFFKLIDSTNRSKIVIYFFIYLLC